MPRRANAEGERAAARDTSKQKRVELRHSDTVHSSHDSSTHVRGVWSWGVAVSLPRRHGADLVRLSSHAAPPLIGVPVRV